MLTSSKLWLSGIVPRVRLFGTIVLASLCSPMFGLSTFGADPPNVVIVMTDDQGYGDLSCHGNNVLKTPHLDSLYRHAVRLTNYHVSPTCSPTRAALLTGHWANRTGAWHTINGRSLLRTDQVTMADLFRAAGYATGMFGKWHLGDNYPYRPRDRGFDEVMRHGGGGIGQTPDFWDNAYFDATYWHNGKPTPVKGFCTDVFFDYAKRFINKQKQEGKPFFVYLATNAAHGPMHAPPGYSRPYQSHGKHVANFYGMLANLDHNVGRLRRFLTDEGLAENTIFIFTTDNGTAGGRNVFNAGMRGRKGSPYEGGHRVPFFLHWPNGSLDQPVDVDRITAHVDILPTLLDLCRIKRDDLPVFDGVSLKSLLAQPPSPAWPDRIVVTDSQRMEQPEKWRNSCVMTSRYRLVNRRELYDIEQDPAQRNNIALDAPKIVARLEAFYDRWWDGLQHAFSQTTPIYIGASQENPTLLTCHDWTTKQDQSSPWHQGLVRQGPTTQQVDGYWRVNVVRDGTYRFGLRRWPPETHHPITAGLPPGAPSPGEFAHRMHPGTPIAVESASISIGNQTWSKTVSKTDHEAVFEVALQAGQTDVKATFDDHQGKRYGAYYLQVYRDTQSPH